MKRTLLILTFLIAFSDFTFSHEKNFRFINGNIYNGDGFEKKDFFSVDGNFMMSYNGKIDSTIDLLNMYVVPPFADAHNHIIADGKDYKEQIDKYLRQGIFYIKNPNNTSKLTEPLKTFVNIPESVDIIYSNGGLTATGGHPVQIYKFIADEGLFSGWTNKDMENQAYFIIDNEKDI
ncbi:MAG: hypothetical protein M3R36_12165 [Bacteroidota bacterium]|nr:hypothetical protein [Bacteroidota bacterium]